MRYGGYSNTTRVVIASAIGIVYGGYGKRDEREMSAIADSSGLWLPDPRSSGLPGRTLQAVRPLDHSPQSLPVR